MSDSTGQDNHGAFGQTAHRVAGGLHGAVEQAGGVAQSTGAGIAEFRQIIRGQPITMAFLMFGLGYVLGRVLYAGPRDPD